jgi:putative aldouronate transport system substrate-binding protein
LNEVLYNRLIADFFDETAPGDVFLNYKVMLRLNDLKKEMPAIQSIYLVRFADDLIFNGNLIHSIRNFADYPFLQNVQKNKSYNRWSGVRQFREWPSQDPKQVVSLVLQAPIPEEKGLVVVNVDTAAIGKMAGDLQAGSSPAFLLSDGSGQILYEHGKEGGQGILSSYTSEYTGWKVQSGLGSGGMPSAAALSSAWLYIGFVVFLAGIFLIVQVTRKNYRPIQRMIARVIQLRGDHPLGGVDLDEFKFLEASIEHFIGMSIAQKKLAKETERQKKLIHELIQGRSPAVSAAGTGLPEMAEGRPFRAQALIVEIDRAESFFRRYSETDQYLFKFVVSSVAHELFGGRLREPVLSDWVNRHRLCLVVFPELPEPELLELCASLKGWVEQNLAFTVSIGVGGPVRRLEDIRTSYQQAQEVLNYKAVEGVNRLYPYEAYRERIGRPDILSKHLKDIQRMVDSCRMGDESWKQQLQGLVSGFRKDRLHKDSLKFLMAYFINYLQSKRPGIPGGSEGPNGQAPRLYGMAERIETLEDWMEACSEELQRLSSRLAALRETQSHRGLMLEIRSCIERQYANPDLSLNFLGERFGIPPKYVSQLFKQHYGQNFTDFLHELRIRRAMELLQGEPVPIQDIYGQVGFANPVTLSAFVSPSPQIENLDTNTFTKTLESKLNIQFKFEVAPSAGANDRKQLLLASGDYPDIFLSGNLTQAEQLKYGKQGVLIPLNDLIAQYGSNIKAAFKKKPELEKAITAPDGNIYALPSVNDCFHCWYSQKMWINTSWLKKLNLKMPTTTEEYYQVLKAFKTRDPNGNGKQDEIPLSGAVGGWHTEVTGFLMNAFIYDNEQDYFYMKNGKVALAAAQPEWRKGLEYIHRLYAEGLIDPASFTQNTDALAQIGNRPGDNILGSTTVGHIGMAFSTKPGETRHKEYDTVPPLIGPDGNQTAGYYNSIGNGNFAITNKASKAQAVAAIKLADYLYTEEAAVLNEWGPENLWWRKGQPGEVDEHGRQAKYFLKPEFYAQQTQNEEWAQMGILFRDRNYRESWAVPKDPYGDDGYEHRLYMETAKNYEGKEPKETFPLDIFMESADASEAAQLKTQINDYIKSNTVQFITGNKSLSTDWDAYLKGLKGLKLSRYLEIYQNAYDRIYKKN